jgi:hypothetical protein
MRIFLFLLLFLFASTSICAQTSPDSLPKRNGYALWLIPSARDNIYGIAIGLFGSEIICNRLNTKKSHGINLQLIGQGLFIPLNKKAFGYQNLFSTDTSWMVVYKDSSHYKAIHNGLLITTFGSMTDVSNGIVLSAWFSLGTKANGLIVNALANKYTQLNGVAISLSNQSYAAKGIQIGLINRTRKLHGFQFGLWNVNDRRKLPIINWNFRNQ